MHRQKSITLDNCASWIDKLPLELVDIIFDFAEYWPHTSSCLEQPVRAYGPFTWRWGGKINYSKLWSPQGPAYAHRWSRWGQSREENSFLLRSPPLALRSSRLNLYQRIVPRQIFSFLTKTSSVVKTVKSHRTPNDWLLPRGIHPAKKIVFELYCRQDYFGATTFNANTVVRLFCDVTIDRRTFVREKGSKGPQLGTIRKEGNGHCRLITYKPFILERWFEPRHSEIEHYIITWECDGDQENELPSEEGFPTVKAFMRTLEVGDSIGVWARVGEGETYHIIDGMRMHVFWTV